MFLQVAIANLSNAKSLSKPITITRSPKAFERNTESLKRHFSSQQTITSLHACIYRNTWKKQLNVFKNDITKSVPWRCSIKKLFLEIQQNSPDNNCAKAYFLMKLQASTCIFSKKETVAQVFSCEFCKISKNIFSYGTPLMAAFYSKGSRTISLTSFQGL